MPDLELVLKFIALLVAIALLISSVDFSYLLAKLSVKVDETIDVPDVTPSINVNDDKSFMKTLELWYLLKKQCDNTELTNASKKLDEVFPLLNDNLEE